jgi:hypothetical protein
LAAATGLTTVQAHSGAESGPLIAAAHIWLHAGGGEFLTLACAVLAGLWVVIRHHRATRR